MKIRLVAAMCCFAAALPVFGAVKLPGVISSGMVLQRGVPVKIWGEAEPGEKVAVQIAGALAVQSGFDGVICLPGSHTKWAHISAGEVVSFQSFMTGEIFALLSTQSALKDTIAAQGFDEAAFDAA